MRKGKEVRKDETMDNSNGIYAAQADRAYCVDAIDFMRMLPDKSIDLIIADPPYYRINGFFDFSSIQKKIICYGVWNGLSSVFGY